MGISRFIFVLVIVFGSSSWIGTNSVWMQLPLLTSDLPEHWNLPSYLAAVVQIACIGPLIYTILHKGCPNFSMPTAPLITAFLLLACLCQLGLVFFWKKTALIGGQSYSIALYLLLFGLAIVNAISNVLFMPFMATFHMSYLNAYFVGMGFSSLVPSILSLIQGTGNYDCMYNNVTQIVEPQYMAPRFSVSVFFMVIFVWTCLATFCFGILYREGAHRHEQEREENEDTPLNKRSITTQPEVDTSKSLEAERSESPPMPAVFSEVSSGMSRGEYAFVLIATALVNAQMNGVIPSIQSYATLPYSQATYHFGLTLSNVVSPIASFVPFYLTIRSYPVLMVLTALSSMVTSFIVYLAVLSPDLLFGSISTGSALSIISSLLAAGLHSYLRIVFATLLREGEHCQSRLFWCGVFIQIGSFIGSVAMFPLVNVWHLFQSASPCHNALP